MAHTIQDTLTLARAFGDEVQAAFDRPTFIRICDLNKGKYSNTLNCATHDFCDANLLMLSAFVTAFGRDPLDGPLDGISDADALLWNDAWAVAKAADFFA